MMCCGFDMVLAESYHYNSICAHDSSSLQPEGGRRSVPAGDWHEARATSRGNANLST